MNQAKVWEMVNGDEDLISGIFLKDGGKIF